MAEHLGCGHPRAPGPAVSFFCPRCLDEAVRRSPTLIWDSVYIPNARAKARPENLGDVIDMQRGPDGTWRST